MRYCPTCNQCYDDRIASCATDGAPTQFVLPGPCVLAGKFEIVRLLGQGGMGAVFEAVQRGIERRVAVKLINPTFVADPASRERFRREALACGRVKHPNAITVYDYGVTDEGLAYLAMEFLSGTSLRDELARARPFSPERAAELFDPICAALESAHRQGITHRDLKPDNIFLETLDDGSVSPKVLDFGIAKLKAGAADGSALTGLGAIGTPAYMSPEQARGLDVDARSDIYSLAVVVYEVLAGRLPFEASSPLGYIVQHATAAPTPLSVARPGLPAGVETVVMRALEKSPDARQQSALEFGRELGRAIAPVLAPAPAPPASFSDAVAIIRRLAVQAVGPAGVVPLSGRLAAWPVGLAPGIAPSTAAEDFAEIAREFAAAAVQRIPYGVIFDGARAWAQRRWGTPLLPPQALPDSPLAAQRTSRQSGTAAIALYCAAGGVSWAIRSPEVRPPGGRSPDGRSPEGVEQPLALTPTRGGTPVFETVPEVTSYYVDRLPGGGVVTLVARAGGAPVWSDNLALADDAVSLVLCVPQSMVARQGPSQLTHLFGAIEVGVAEPGADIFVDDGPDPWGATGEGGHALLSCVVPGRHGVRIRKGFFLPLERVVEVEAGGRARVEGTLDRARAAVRVGANVDGVRVELAGPEPSPNVVLVQLGEPGSVERRGLPAGVYRLCASRAGYVDARRAVTLNPDEEETVRLSLEPVGCPVCGEPAAVGTFVCPSCGRGDIHTGHRHQTGVCAQCAARDRFGRAQGLATVDGWRGYLDEFRDADGELAARAAGELRKLLDEARRAQIGEWGARFAALARQGTIGEAVAACRSAAAQSPASADARLALAMALEAAGDKTAACEAYGVAAEQVPDDALVRRAHGRLLAGLGRSDAAVREYTAAVRLKHDFADAHFEFASLLLQLGSVDSAVEGFRAALAQRPDDALFTDALGGALAACGRHREAGDALTRAARCFADRGDHSRADDARRRARAEYDKTVLRRAGKFIKNFFDRE